ncbi:DNA-binding protein [Elizabethkingia anophelis]|nr:DNA-binding protein [Elizabethkingia anophelis]
MQRLEVQLQNYNANSTPVKEEPEYLTRREVAELLGITLPTLHNWTKKGIITAYRIGTRLRYNKVEIIEVLNKNKV